MELWPTGMGCCVVGIIGQRTADHDWHVLVFWIGIIGIGIGIWHVTEWYRMVRELGMISHYQKEVVREVHEQTLPFWRWDSIATTIWLVPKFGTHPGTRVYTCTIVHGRVGSN